MEEFSIILTLDQLRRVEKALEMSLVVCLDKIQDEMAREIFRNAFLEVFQIFEESYQDSQGE